MECELLILNPAVAPAGVAVAPDQMITYAVRLNAPEMIERIPSHFILLIDVSESMMDANKLANVKQCASLILNFMKEHDRISLISFGEDATLHLKRVAADEGNKASIRHTINELVCHGCTNLSAGLGYVREVCEGDTQKTGLLILTDGHANRGASRPAELRSIIGGLTTAFPHLSVHCVAYGSDHNEELMRAIAEDVQGSYNVVNSIEDTAFAFGDTLGGLMSCAHQNVRVEVPAGCTVAGSYKTREDNTTGRMIITVGDVYAGTKPLILFKVPTEFGMGAEIHVRGMALPDLVAWSVSPIPQTCTERQKDIELARYRYLCTLLLKDIHGWSRLSAEQKEKIPERINLFENAMNDPFFNDDPVGALLRGEVQVMRVLLARAQSGYNDHEAHVITSQHITSIGLGRGFSSPMARHGARRSAFPRAPSRPGPGHLVREQWGNVWSGSDEEADPVGIESRPPVTWAFQNTLQTQIAELMREASQQPQPHNSS
jgi:hypothetical protein